MILIRMVLVRRDWINTKVMNDVTLVIYCTLTFATDVTSRSSPVEAWKDK